jgi:hypothetical protein
MCEADSTANRWSGRLAALALAAAILVSGLLAFYPIHSFDLWWHLRTGQLILEQGRIPHTDPFSYTASGRPWVTHEWLAEVLFYLLHRTGGANLLVIWKALLCALTLGLAGWAGLVGHRARERLPATALGILLAAPLLAIRAFVRPHLLTALLLAVTLLLLRKESATGRPAWRWALPPLFLLWANLHSGFLLGLGLVALYWTGEAISIRIGAAGPAAEPRWRGRLIALGASLLSTLVNPHHVEALLYPLKLVANPVVTGMIAELQSPFDPRFRGALFLWFLLLCALALAALLPGRLRRLQGSLILPGAVFAVLALQAVRSVSELAVLVPALVAAHGERLSGRRVVAAVTSALVLLGAIGLGLLASGPGIPMGKNENPRRTALGIHQVNLPGAAVEFLRQTRPPGRVFGVMGFSSWMIYKLWPEKEVYIDGRLDVFPPEFLEDYGTMMTTGEGWDEAVARYDIQMALVDYPDPAARGRGLHGRLREDPDWVCVFFSDNALVYARRLPQNKEIISRYGIAFDPGLRTRESLVQFAAGASPAVIDQTLAALQRINGMAPGEEAPGLILQGLRDVKTGQKDGTGQVVNLLNRADEELAAGRADAALETLEQAATLAPENGLVQLRLGVLHARAGRLEQAEACLSRAVKLRPGDGAARQNLERVRRMRQP